jgi:transposase
MKNVKKGFSLSDDEKKFLGNSRSNLKGYAKASLRNRIRGILLVGSGMLNEEAAEVCKVHVRTLRRWLADYREGKIDGLKHKKGAGKPSRLSAEQNERLREIVKAGPEVAGYETGRWTAVVVKDLILKEFGVRYSVQNVQRILGNLGFSFKLPKKNLPGQTPTKKGGGWT